MLGNTLIETERQKKESLNLWQIKINNACRSQGISYSRFIHALKEKKVGLDRKVLADIAENHPQIFKKIVERVT